MNSANSSSENMQSENLCSVEYLKAKLEFGGLVILDASWHMPSATRNAYDEFLQKHIPGAAFWDIDAIADLSIDLPHMLPTSALMNEVCKELGISPKSEIVIYDTAGLFSAARAWWTFKAFGYQNVKVLDGGLPAWLNTNGAVESGASKTIAQSIENQNQSQDQNQEYFAERDETFLVTRDVLIQNSESKEYMVLDARSKGRFDGTAPEPRPELRSGHMPNSCSLPFDHLIADGRLKPKEELLRLFAEFGLNPDLDDKKLVTSCGSGVTAAIITLALIEAGFTHHRLYDGAWCDWASATDTIVLSKSGLS